ncbi:MAG: hypothetical protein ACXV8Q_06670 [Methylobacter sp.]
MKTKKVIHEISDTINMDSLDPTNFHLFKLFSLPIWLVIITISLSFVTKSVRAGTEDMHHYFRYVPYEGPKSTTGTDSQRPKQSSGANDADAKKANAAEQATSAGAKAESAGTRNEEAQKTSPSEPAKKTDESTGQTPKEPAAATGSSGQAPASGSQPTNTQQSASKHPETECPMAGNQKSATDRKIPPVKRPEKDTGEFPSGEFPSFCHVDVNGDHYVTKDELQNFPELLKVFDKVDAGKDGKLEQHEFQNLEMETTREGEVS